jgi:predicted DNA-binding transcriptional regulator AlpA
MDELINLPQSRKQNQEPLKLLNCKQVSTLLGKSEKTLSTWRQRGYGPPFIRVGKSAMYLESDLMEWFRSNKKTNTI